MGDGQKVPHSQRPSMDLIRSRVSERIRPELSQLFLWDIQNDCGCSTEIYDADVENKFVYLHDRKKIAGCSDTRLVLPMMTDIDEEDILLLLEEACKQAPSSLWNDTIPTHVLYRKGTHISNARYITDIRADRWVALPFIPEKTIFVLPEPEFFGCISVNIDKFGAFCSTRTLMKIDLI